MKKYFKIVSLALAMMFICAGESNAQTGELGKTLRRMDTYNEKLITLSATITVGRQNTQLGDEPELRFGTLIYAKRPGQESLIRIDWAKPKEYMAVVDGEYTLFKPAGGNGVAYRGRSKDAVKHQKSNSALVFLNMSKQKLDSDYVPTWVGDATLSDGTRAIQIKLTPKNKTSHKSANIWIDKDGMLRQASIVENNDDITTLLLTKFTPNPSLKKSDFKIELPNGTKVEKT